MTTFKVPSMLTVAVLMLTGCGSGSNTTVADKPSEPASLSNSADGPSSDQVPPVPESTTYQGDLLDNTRLFPSLEAAQKFFGSNIDGMNSLLHGGLQDMPALVKDQTVTINKQAEGDYRLITTADGKTGCVVSTLIESPFHRKSSGRAVSYCLAI
jgi:hypothetical protein